MQAVVGAPGEALRLGEIATPRPRSDQALIRVVAAGINRPDLLQRDGRYPPPPGAPETLGLEVAGEIVVPDAEGRWREGERVCALLPGGGYAQYAAAHAGSILPLPEGLGMREAAGLPETVFTVWNNVFDACSLKPGETFLVHGGASGIGTTAMQMAAAWGARVFATAGTDEKCRLCERLGAERGINYRTEDFANVLNITGVDVILDMVGAPYLERNLQIMKDRGRLAWIAFLHGSKVEADLLRVMLKRLTLTGSTLRPRTDAFKAALAGKVREHVWPMIAAGRLKPLVHAVRPLADAAAALAELERGEHAGKIVLDVAPD
jgi:putative PIG3 family NAD(P)H quinone oxidoreductase